jgi:hypothetical protein
MVKKSETKILAIISICIILLTIGFSGCFDNEKSENDQKEMRETFGVRITHVNLVDGSEISGSFNITWDIVKIPLANAILLPGNFTDLHYSLNNETNWNLITTIQRGDSGSYAYLWNTTELPNTRYCQLSIRVVGSKGYDMVIIKNIIINNK